jgi:hypothetical protein
MAREDEVMALMESLVIATDKEVGEIMASRGHWGEGQSARVQASKSLKNLIDLSKLERRNGVYRLPGCKSEYKEHAQLLTKSLAQILKLNPAVVHRELTIPEVGLRPDAICFAIKNQHGLCFVLEVMNNETPEYLKRKINVWNHWKNSKDFLGNLFGYCVPNFLIAVSGGEVIDGTVDFKQVLEELR